MKSEAYPEELREYYSEKLQEILIHRRSVKPYDSEDYTLDVDSIEEFQKLPMISKNDLVSGDRPEVLLSQIEEKTVSCGATSGTSGNPTICLRNESDIEKFQERMEKKPDAHYFPDDSRTLVIVDHQLQNEMVESLKKMGKFVVIGHPKKLGFTVEIMEGLDIDTIYTYPSFALKIGKEFEEKEADPEIIERLVMGGEKLSTLARDKLQEMFPEAKLSQTWGSTEQSRCGYQTEDLLASNRYRIYEKLHFHEIVDPETGEPLEKGEIGELVTTTLWKDTGVPLLRYRTGDKAVIKEEEGPEGHSDLVIEMKGRVEFDKVHLNGYKFFEEELESALDPIADEIRGQYQVVIEDTTLEGNVVPELKIFLSGNSGGNVENLGRKVMDNFEVEEGKMWKDAMKNGELGSIEIEFVEEIEPERLKTRKVVDKRTRP